MRSSVTENCQYPCGPVALATCPPCHSCGSQLEQFLAQLGPLWGGAHLPARDPSDEEASRCAGRCQLCSGFRFLFVRKSTVNSGAWVGVGGGCWDEVSIAEKLEIWGHRGHSPPPGSAELVAVRGTEGRVGVNVLSPYRGGHVRKCVLRFGGTHAGSARGLTLMSYGREPSRVMCRPGLENGTVTKCGVLGKVARNLEKPQRCP